MAVVGSARYDKYEPHAGGFRAPTDAALVEADVNKIFGVGLNSSGRVVKGAGQSGIIGVLVVPSKKAAGDIVDVMTGGEIVGATLSDGTTALDAGKMYYVDPTTGAVTATATGNVPIGFTVEASRLIVRLVPTQAGA